MRKIKNKLLPLITLLLFVLCMGLVSADPVVTLSNSSFTTTDTTPTVSFSYTHSTNATANCSLFMGGTIVATNGSVANNTVTGLTSTTTLDYERYSTYVNCSTADGNSNVSSTITVSVSQIDCSGVEKTLAQTLISVFMLGIIVFLAFTGIRSGDAKMLIAAAVAVIFWIICLGVINPVIISLCG